jgi:hypothetical protein
MSNEFFSSVVKTMHSSRAGILQLVPGQVLSGEVMKIYPNQTATVRLGNHQINAQLEAAMEVGRKYWFQVQSGRNPIMIRLLPAEIPDQRMPERDIDPLLRHMGFNRSGSDEALIRFFLQEKLPMHKSTLQEVKQLLPRLDGPMEERLRAVQQAHLRGLPLSADTVRSVQTFLFTDGATLFERLVQLVEGLPQQERALLQGILDQLRLLPVTKENIASQFQYLGLQYERNLAHLMFPQQAGVSNEALGQANEMQANNLKAILLQLLQSTSLQEEGKAIMQQLISYLSGQQLLLQPDFSNQQLVQYLFHLPVFMNGKWSMIYGQLETKRTPKGVPDSDNCRLIFFLHLQNLGDTCVDTVIDYKQLKVVIYNETFQLTSWLKELRSPLEASLHQLGYSLGTLEWKRVVKQNHKHNPSGKPNYSYNQAIIQGVDIRI